MASGIQVNVNDDVCGVFAAIDTVVSDAHGCHEYKLSIGCYSENSCSVTVRGTKVTPEPVMPPTMYPTEPPTEVPEPFGQAVVPALKSSLPFTVNTGMLHHTSSATVNSYVMAFDVCDGDFLFIDTCNDYSDLLSTEAPRAPGDGDEIGNVTTRETQLSRKDDVPIEREHKSFFSSLHDTFFGMVYVYLFSLISFPCDIFSRVAFVLLICFRVKPVAYKHPLHLPVIRIFV